MTARPGTRGGFTIVELLIVMAISLYVLAAASQVLIGMTTQFKQQSRIAQSGIESGFGLEALRKDLSMAGFGMPTGILVPGTTAYTNSDWISLAAAYKEVNPDKVRTEDPDKLEKIAAQFNDGAPHYRAPRLVMSGISNDSGAPTFNASDYLVIRGANMSIDPTAGKFIIYYMKPSATGGQETRVSNWNPGASAEKIEADPWSNPGIIDPSWVIVTTTRDSSSVGLINSAATVATLYKSSEPDFGLGAFAPSDYADLSIVYGICSPGFDSASCPLSMTTLRAPFNRTDYYISREGASNKCAPGTGVLYKAEMSQSDGSMGRRFKILDCVADMQVVYETADGGLTDNVSGMSGLALRNELEEVQVYILTHEGQFDPNYTYKNPTIYVGPTGFGREFKLQQVVQAEVGGTSPKSLEHWSHYRWRVVKLGERPVGKGAYVN